MTQFQDDVQIDGNLRVGDDPSVTNAMVEAYRDGASTETTKRGLQVSGTVDNEDNPTGTLQWSVHELALGGDDGDTLLEASALRVALTLDDDQNLDTGVGIDVQVEQILGATGDLNEVIGLRVDAAGAVNADDNYAIQTLQGKVQIGDKLEVANGILGAAVDVIVPPTELPSAAPNIQLGTVTTDPLPTDYAILWLKLFLRSTEADTSDLVYLRFNNDSGNNYRTTRTTISQSGLSAAGNEMGGVGYFYPTWCDAANSPANHYTAIDLFIYGYKDSNKYKKMLSSAWQTTDNIAAWRINGGGVWESTAVIQEIDILPAVGPNWAAGSMYALYGIGG